MSVLADRLVAFAEACKAKFDAQQALINAIPDSSFIMPQQFGSSIGTGGDDTAAFVAMAAAVDNAAGNNLTGYGSGTPPVRIPFTKAGYNLTQQIVFNSAPAIYGDGNGLFGGAASYLKWPAGTGGFKFMAPNWYVDGLALVGGWMSSTVGEAEEHAIHAINRGAWGRLFVNNWKGDGVHVDTGADGGNCNGMVGTVGTFSNCRSGLSMVGSNANAGRFEFINAEWCRLAGVLDNSSFGNGYGVIQAAGCGQVGALGTAPLMCFNNGHIYTVAAGQAAGASTNGPPSTATGNTWWLYCFDLASAPIYAPQWTSGQTWREGGAVHSTASLSNAMTVDHLYAEFGQPVIQTGAQGLIKGGQNASGYAPATRYIRASSAQNGVQMGPNIIVDQTVTAANLLLGTGGFININGQQVLQQRVGSTPAAATDLASALTLVNFLRSAGLTHGFIG